MTDEQQISYVNAQAAAAQIEAAGMTAENMQRAALGQSMAYDVNAFTALIDKYGISHNTVLCLFREFPS